MRLRSLVESARALAPAHEWDVVGADVDPDVTGLRLDSRRVTPGDLFFCVPGEVTDGHRFGADAVAAGAVALLVEHELDLPVPQIKVTSARPAMAWLSVAYHGRPSDRLEVVGITGTNGKTTTAHLVQAILQSAGRTTAVLGTLTGARTTPEAPHLQQTFASLAADGTEAVAMEVSSHALDQDRVTGTDFDVGVFTNLSADHLDYHGTFERYFEAKARLFAPDMVRAAVINTDDPRGQELFERADVPVVGYSRSMATDVDLRMDHTSFTWRGRRVDLALPGLFNLENAIAAAEAVRLLGLDDDVIAAGLTEADPVRGRFEVVAGMADAQATVIVDYSHTPAGIEQVLRSVREISPDAEVCIVFGAGGDRDKEKRPLMGQAAMAADHLVVTSDNPRSENPQRIIDDIVAGIARHDRVQVEVDRRAAIAIALSSHGPGDVVVVAGKGHETTQTIGDEVLDFDDRAVVRELIQEAGA